MTDPTDEHQGARNEHEAVARESILEAISRIAGQAPRIQLRDESSSGAAAAPAASDDDSAIPEMPDESHEIRRLIASGGMGSVYKGRDLELGRDVAIKVLHTQFSNESAVLQRFVEEAQIGGQLQHPGIVPVYEIGLLADERPFFTMKLVKAARFRPTWRNARRTSGADVASWTSSQPCVRPWPTHTAGV